MPANGGWLWGPSTPLSVAILAHAAVLPGVIVRTVHCFRMASNSEDREPGAPEQVEPGAPEHVRIGAAQHFGELIPIVEVAFQHDKWWSLPQDMSRQLYEQQQAGLDARLPVGRRLEDAFFMFNI